MCGDHLSISILMILVAGSPPHVRGPLINQTNSGGSAGITPACAGTTSTHMSIHGTPWDHPRMCGDHLF